MTNGQHIDETKRLAIHAMLTQIKLCAAPDMGDLEGCRRMAHAIELLLCDMPIEEDE